MTNREAIEILGQYDVSDLHFYTTDGEEIPFTEWSDAIEMAISALHEQELKQEVKNSNESSLTQKGLNTISRQAAIDAIKSSRFLVDAMEKVIKLPSAQPEIIHCKDCKHFGVDRYKKLTWCSRINYGYGYQANDFCSKAERRTDDLQ